MEFLPKWNSTTQFLDTHWTAAEQLDLWTDEATSTGAGGFWKKSLVLPSVAYFST